MGQEAGGSSAAAQVIFGLLASIAGLATLALAALTFERFHSESDQAWVTLAVCIVSGVLTAAFGGVCALAAAERRKSQAIAGRRALHPEEPWLWAEEWQQGRIEAVRGRPGAVALIIFAAFWNAMVITAGVLGSQRYDLLRTPSLAITLLIFALAGLFLIGIAVYMTLLVRKYDPVVLQMTQLPGILGGSLSGTLGFPAQVQAGTEVNVDLTCERVSGSGKNSVRHCLWQDVTRLRASPAGSPVAFRIPFDLPPSDSPGKQGTTRVQWWLRAKASVPGVDYNAIFEVPVFATAASDHSIVAGTVDASLPAGRPSNAKSSIIESTLSRTVVALPPAKGLGCGIAAFLLFPLAWLISRYAQADAELTVMIYGAALLLFCGALALVCLGLLLTAVRIEIDRDALRVPHGRGPLRWVRTVPLPNVAEFKYASSGDPPTQRIDVHTRDGKSYMISGELSGLEEARWLTAELTRAVERYRK